MYADAFSAGVDYLGTRTLSIATVLAYWVSVARWLCHQCGQDGSASKPATVSMYDMGAVTRHGLGRSVTVEQRQAMLAKAAEQRTTSSTSKCNFELFAGAAC
jgi:hypothetical protein